MLLALSMEKDTHWTQHSTKQRVDWGHVCKVKVLTEATCVRVTDASYVVDINVRRNYLP